MKRLLIITIILLSISLPNAQTRNRIRIVAAAQQGGAGPIPDSRRIDWTLVGVPGGIPVRTTICATISADTTGGTDASSAFQTAINGCGANQVVFIPTGTYKLLSKLTITNNNITLRGSNTQAVVLNTSVADDGFLIGQFPGSSITTNVTGSPAKGATQITVTSAAAYSTNDYIVIDQTNDGTEVNNTADAGNTGPDITRSSAAETTTRSLQQLTQITAINSNTLTISPPLYHSYSSSLNPAIWKVNQGTQMTTGVGLEDFTIHRVNTPATSENDDNIRMVACVGCWVMRVQSDLAQFRHVDIDRSFRCSIVDSFFNDGQHQDTGGFAYGVVAGHNSSANLIENNIFYHLRHSMVVKEGGSGNVFSYNYSLATYQGDTFLAPDLFGHGAHSNQNLFEGNYATKIDSDWGHGSSSYNTYYRNYASRDSSAAAITGGRWAVNLAEYNTSMNIVGNVLGQNSQSWDAYEDPGTRAIGTRYVYAFGYQDDGSSTTTNANAKNTVYRHGNFDYQTNSTIWDPSQPSHVLPDSLYLSAKPSWWGNEAWPPIGGDLTTKVSDIPAKTRYEHLGTVRTSSTSSSTDVQTQVNAASSTLCDVVVVPSGSSSWSTPVSISNKCLTLLGGKGGTTTVTNSRALTVSSASASKFVRITGFTFSSSTGDSSGIVEIDGATAGTREVGFRFDHNTFTNVSSSIGLHIQGIYGVVDNNTAKTSSGTNHVIEIYGSSQSGDHGYSPWTFANQLGSAMGVYFEDNNFTNDVIDQEEFMDGYTGARIVARHNTIQGKIELHGTDSGGNRGVVSMEVYANSYVDNLAGATNAVVVRGGTLLAFDNTFSGSSENYGGFILNYYRVWSSGCCSWQNCNGTNWDIQSSDISSDNSTNAVTANTGARFLSANPDTISGAGTRYLDGSGTRGYPCRDQPGVGSAGQSSQPIYVWNNGGKTSTPDDHGCGACGGFPISTWMASNRDYFNYVSPGFDGTSGVGRGTFANRPTTCTAGVAYFATDVGVQGTLYKCTSTNVWAIYFTPYFYPHPARGREGRTT